MTWYEILIILVSAAFVIGVIAWSIVRRKRGKTCCSDCGSCPHCSGCARKSEKQEKKS